MPWYLQLRLNKQLEGLSMTRILSTLVAVTALATMALAGAAPFQSW